MVDKDDSWYLIAGTERGQRTLAAPTPLDIARHLAGWGAMIEPSSVQMELARIGAELTARYTGGHAPTA
jgi:hypothetical protein